jgi:hypothetical protein
MILVTFIYKPFETKLQARLFNINYFTRLIMGLIAILIEARPDKISTSQVGWTLIILTVTTIGINSLVSLWLVISLIIKFCRSQRSKSQKITPISNANAIMITGTEDTVQGSPVKYLNESIKTPLQQIVFTDKDSSSNFQFEIAKIKKEELESDADRLNLIKEVNLCSGENNTQSTETAFGESLKYITSKIKVKQLKLKRAIQIGGIRQGKDTNCETKLKISDTEKKDPRTSIFDQLGMTVEEYESLKVLAKK